MVAQGWADVKDDTTGRSAECGSHHATHDQQRIEPVKIWSIVMEGWCKRAGKVRESCDAPKPPEMEDAAEAAQ
jgi:hypothetical protein